MLICESYITQRWDVGIIRGFRIGFEYSSDSSVDQADFQFRDGIFISQDIKLSKSPYPTNRWNVKLKVPSPIISVSNMKPLDEIFKDLRVVVRESHASGGAFGKVGRERCFEKVALGEEEGLMDVEGGFVFSYDEGDGFGAHESVGWSISVEIRIVGNVWLRLTLVDRGWNLRP